MFWLLYRGELEDVGKYIFQVMVRVLGRHFSPVWVNIWKIKNLHFCNTQNGKISVEILVFFNRPCLSVNKNLIFLHWLCRLWLSSRVYKLIFSFSPESRSRCLLIPFRIFALIPLIETLFLSLSLSVILLLMISSRDIQRASLPSRCEVSLSSLFWLTSSNLWRGRKEEEPTTEKYLQLFCWARRKKESSEILFTQKSWEWHQNAKRTICFFLSLMQNTCDVYFVVAFSWSEVRVFRP